MKMIIDCMGGDNAPLEMLKGVIDAKAELGGEYLLVGRKETLEAVARENGLDISGFEILHAETVITMEDDSMAFREKKDSSMTLALRALANGEGDAMVSCGNTGTLFAGASLTVRRIKGVHRAALAAVLPFNPPVLLLDCGANVTVQPEFLPQFAAMGSAYMKALYGLENPRVGLLNNGGEEHKGTPLQTEAYQLLKNCPDIRFVGNVEGNQVPFGACDVLVADGYTGNVLLKTMEGMGKLFMTRMKGIFYASLISKLAALTVKKSFMQFKKDMDVKEHGGSPILGLRKPVIKAHGSSDARAFKNAIRQAMRFAESGATETIERLLGTEAPAGKE
ncbi:MAG: phosphate acyltransferase PlsX [Clostridia bacterium]|nr:phosphate acyltransferase PlsX [Clostridia bacterium]